jgi:hypothetical protein
MIYENIYSYIVPVSYQRQKKETQNREEEKENFKESSFATEDVKISTDVMLNVRSTKKFILEQLISQITANTAS